eukprot:scaffold23952_cov63-Phaeocystis_antarctica.AAC.3
MLCDLRRHGYTLSMPAAGGVDILSGGTNSSHQRDKYNKPKVFFQYPLDQGILVPELGLNLSMYTTGIAAAKYCTAREAGLQVRG